MNQHDQNKSEIEQRRASRFTLDQDINVRAKGSRQMWATLTSLSRFGCRVAGASLSRSDDLVWVRISGLESQAAELRWSEDGEAGLEFRYPLHVAVADHYRVPDVTCEPGYQLASRSTNGFGRKLFC
ncbi:hypothetical protein G7A66_12250 [Altererythrobacter sp. SALINAS58]|uniref:hypothetical protein n=1 Tax=Alteripontixanthobacter muriae TaxID=2705546 RepID=UPI001574FC2E|nr:hypothetical protein [Alteripontixanthobacter muriae]NTZ43841.1 hypothetical protein [Alteripontixanthobacter muriae]